MQDSQYLGALTTLHNAIKINLSAFMFPHSPTPFAITEGITEFYVFNMVKEFTEIFKDIEVSFIPATGVTHLDQLIPLAITWSDKYVVIFDKDEEANKSITKYEGEYGEHERINHWIQINNQQNDKKVTLEKLFSDDDIARLKTITGKSNPKKAFGELYYLSQAEKKKFWGDINDETRANFTIVAGLIAGIINKQ